MKQRQNKPLALFVFLLAAIVLLAGCAQSLTGKAYQGLHAAAITYDEAMQAAGDAYRAGLISEKKKAAILDVANKYRTAHLAAVSALEAYKATGDATAEMRLDVALEQFERFSGELLELVTPYLTNKET